MDKFNKRFNNSCARFAFWQAITAHLASFDDLLKAQYHLTPEDVKALKEIHSSLYKCYTSAKARMLLHKDYLYSIRKEDNS